LKKKKKKKKKKEKIPRSSNRTTIYF